MLKILIVSLMLSHTISVSAQAVSDEPEHFLRVPVSGLVAFTPEKIPETEALIRSKLLDDPHSPRIGSPHPALTLVCFTDYNAKDCKTLDEKLHQLLKLHPNLALVYKLVPPVHQPDNPSRMALTLWEKQPEKFPALHREMMRFKGVLDDFAVRSALRQAGGQIYHLSPDASHTIAVNVALMKTLHITDMPATLIGDHILPGDVQFDELESAVIASLKGA